MRHLLYCAFLRLEIMQRFLRSLFLIFISAYTVCSAQEPSPNNKPFFRGSQKQPYHLSIGAVLFDQEGRIACHHFQEFAGYKDVYILMRETMENGETPLMTLHRGLKEEFGATAEPVAFLGGLSGYIPFTRLSGLSFEKTTLYVACQLTKWDPENRDLEDPEAGSTIEWVKPERLISIMEQQGIRFQHRIDADESEIVRRAISYIQPEIVIK